MRWYTHFKVWVVFSSATDWKCFVVDVKVTLACLCTGEGPSLRPDQQGEEVKDHGNSAQTGPALGEQETKTLEFNSLPCVCVRTCVNKCIRSRVSVHRCESVCACACSYERDLQGSAVTGHSSLTGPLLQAAQCSEAWPSLHEALFASLDVPLSRATWLPPFLPSRKEWEGLYLSIRFSLCFLHTDWKWGIGCIVGDFNFELLIALWIPLTLLCFIPSFCPTSRLS